ncbi:CD276 antigen homolog, partial [Etheostoma spectabile]|uniref:CD276 antigen homolog n=1 Tax=Etheostoma spectabile TaxID=54343 RepID=UPI0013AF82BC
MAAEPPAAAAGQERAPRRVGAETEVDPPAVINVGRGADVVLPCSLSTKEDITFKVFVWRRKAPQEHEGQKEVFLYDKGIDNRESSEIQRYPTVENTDVIFLVFSHVKHSTLSLFVEPSKVIKVEEDSDVVLPCSLSTTEDITSELFDWKTVPPKDEGLKEVFLYNDGIHYNNGLVGQSEEFKGRVSHFQDELKHGNASIIIRNTKISDSGVYSCYFPNLQTRQTFYIKLVVGAAPKPYVTILQNQNQKGPNDRSLLQCEVHGDPEPEVEWLDSAGNTLPAEKTQVKQNLFYITLRTTVTQTDHYRCVATQETISHQVSKEISVYFSGLSTGWIVLIVLAVVLALVVGGVIVLMLLVNKDYITLCRNKVIKVEEGSDLTLPFNVGPEKVLTWKKPSKAGGSQKTMFLYNGQSEEVKGQDEQLQGQVKCSPEELKEGNASIII